MDYKIMRMLCMFDLPVETDEERRSYRIFDSGGICYDAVFGLCKGVSE